MTRDSFRDYWTATGVIPRWQLLAVYGLIVTAMAVGFWKLGNTQDDIKDAVDQIQQSRVVLSRQSCRQRNNERAVQRANLRDNLRNLAQIPDASLEALGFTREEAVAQVRKQLRQVRKLDCRRLIRQVAGNRTGRVVGGGSGASAAPRPQATGTAPKGQTGGGGGPDATQPERPPEGGGQAPQPPPGDSQPPSGNGPGPSGPNPSVKPPAVTVPDVRELPRQVAPELCQIDTPLGPILKLCP